MNTLRWLPLKTAAHSSGVSERTLRRWIETGAVLSRRLCGLPRGSLRVAVDGDGFTVPVRRSAE